MTLMPKRTFNTLGWLAFSVAIILSAGCKSQPLTSGTTVATSATGVMETNWQLTRIENVDAETSQAVSGAFTLQLNKDGGASGARLCNRWFGSFEEIDQRFVVNAQGVTKALCLPKQNPQGDDQLNAKLEQRFFDELKKGLTHNGNMLELMTSDGQRWIFTEANQP